MNWQPIETAPKDGTRILLYWLHYAYEVGERGEPTIRIGFWKNNYRIKDDDPDSVRYGMRSEYFADSHEMDDYGLAQDIHQPTHWAPIKPPPGQKWP